MVYHAMDGEAIVRQLAMLIKQGGYDGKIMAAGCRTSTQLGNLIECGIDAVTYDPELLSNEMHVLPSEEFQTMFIERWESKFGKGTRIVDFKKEANNDKC